MKPILLLALILFLFSIPSAQAITIQQNVTFNTSATNTTYIAGENFTVDKITVTQNLLNITNSSTGDFIMSATPSSGPLNITILGFNASYKRFNISSNTSGIIINFVIGNITPVSALMVFLKNGAYWNTFTSNASGYINFTYSEGYSNIQFEALQDTTAPAVSLSLSANTVYQGYAITISCSASDNYQVSSTSLTVTKPGNSQVSSSCGQTFTDTSTAGTYTITYSATDTSGNSASTSQAFTVNSYGGGSGGTATTQNKANQTTKNVTVTAPTIQNTTNITTAPQEPEIKQKAENKINEVNQKIKPEDAVAKQKLSEAESAYSAGDYSKAYSAALEAEGLIGKGALVQGGGVEKKPAVLYYILAIMLLAAIGIYLYKLAQKRGLQVHKDVEEPVKPIESKPPVKAGRTIPKPVKQAPKPKAKDADLDDIQRRLEEIRKKIGK